jgi:hypothetical protein
MQHAPYMAAAISAYQNCALGGGERGLRLASVYVIAVMDDASTLPVSFSVIDQFRAQFRRSPRRPERFGGRNPKLEPPCNILLHNRGGFLARRTYENIFD